ncbi:hypothetical protein E2562_038894 [Oryza meyeriana var. granulata]|uniref:Glutaredoxin domain-containing protein n=1 Tax=Oryza meyeriana var. granulata TaxID=110450 RepID=A0A6G1CBF2_9ORYZ|nr:hypothetical protein E2562_038894 [Oryza meyeriana var. granulata]
MGCAASAFLDDDDDRRRIIGVSASHHIVSLTSSTYGILDNIACNAVRAALESHGVLFRERDISMDRGFREELRHRISTHHDHLSESLVPRLFVRGKHVGGAAEVARLEEEGKLAALLEGLPRALPGCDGCGGMRFLPCFDCNGSRKLCFSLPTPPAANKISRRGRRGGALLMVRCGECNENGLVLCPICS